MSRDRVLHHNYLDEFPYVRDELLPRLVRRRAGEELTPRENRCACDRQIGSIVSGNSTGTSPAETRLSPMAIA